MRIIKGEKQVPVTVRLTDQTGRPVNLTAATEITMRFQRINNANLDKTMTGAAVSIVGSPLLGEIKCVLSEEDVTALKVGRQPLKILVDEGTVRRIAPIPNELTVLE